MPSSVTAVLDHDVAEPVHVTTGPPRSRAGWMDAFIRVRAETEARAAPLSPEDQVIQSMPDASPTKWHRAHTTWFFEQFLLVPHVPAYRVFDERLAFLFNSYYVSAGPRHARPKRGLITRPAAADVAAYRRHVDAAVQDLIGHADDALLATVLPIVEIGLHHEQQHQELMLTDILHAFAQNPILPAYDPAWQPPRPAPGAGDFIALPEAIHTIGHQAQGFSFDNEGPAHRELVGPVRIARHLVTNAEWLEFMTDVGYANSDALAVGRLGQCGGRGLDRARPLARAGRPMVLVKPRRPASGRSGRAGLPRQLLRG